MLLSLVANLAQDRVKLETFDKRFIKCVYMNTIWCFIYGSIFLIRSSASSVREDKRDLPTVALDRESGADAPSTAGNIAQRHQDATVARLQEVGVGVDTLAGVRDTDIDKLASLGEMHERSSSSKKTYKERDATALVSDGDASVFDHASDAEMNTQRRDLADSAEMKQPQRTFLDAIAECLPWTEQHKKKEAAQREEERRQQAAREEMYRRYEEKERREAQQQATLEQDRRLAAEKFATRWSTGRQRVPHAALSDFKGCAHETCCCHHQYGCISKIPEPFNYTTYPCHQDMNCCGIVTGSGSQGGLAMACLGPTLCLF